MPIQPPDLISPTPAINQSPDGDPNILPTDDRSKLFNYEIARPRLQKLIDSWSGELKNTKLRRLTRKLDIDVDSLHRDGKLRPDETFIPVRLCDSAIRREQPPFISFLTQSRRRAIFTPIDGPDSDPSIQILESDFTKGMSYIGWHSPFFKELDGCQVHGWDSIEVEFDPSKPLMVANNHIGHDNLLFPLDAKDIQACQEILRRYELTPYQLRRFVAKYGFDAIQVDNLVKQEEVQNEPPKNIVIYKRFVKFEDVVYIDWLADNQSTSGWLKTSVPLFLGRRRKVETTEYQMLPSNGIDPFTGTMTTTLSPQPVLKVSWQDENESRYPIFLLKYAETEEAPIAETVGRIFLDEPKQNAMTALWSCYVNGSVRASSYYASPKMQTGTGNIPRKIPDLTLEHGCYYSEPIDFWNPPYPSPEMLKAANALDTQHQTETGQVAFAVNNREDSRKTATENTIAAQQQGLLNSVQVTLFSTNVKEVYSFDWYIIQNLANQQHEDGTPIIKLCSTQDPMTGMVINNVQAINRQYIISASGEVDVIQRAEKLNRRQVLWPIVAATPLAMPFLLDMLKEALPEDAERYAMLMGQEQQKDQLIAGLGQSLQAVVTDESGVIKPEFKPYEQQFKQLAQQTAVVLGGGAGNQQPVAA